MLHECAFQYRDRYPFLRERQGVWREIARYVLRECPTTSTVVELGAGYCDFINAVDAPRRIAFDLNSDMAAHAAPGVDFRVADATELPGLADESVDLVFASNFLEHIPRRVAPTILDRVRRVLRPGGRFALIQPNFRFCAPRYFDDETHVAIYSDESLGALLLDSGYEIVRIEPRFLPFSMKSRLPKWPVLVRLYLNSPVRPRAAQMFVVATPR